MGLCQLIAYMVSSHYISNDWKQYLTHAAKYRNRSDQQSARKQWSDVARGLKFVISVQGNDWERFLYLAACVSHK